MTQPASLAVRVALRGVGSDHEVGGQRGDQPRPPGGAKFDRPSDAGALRRCVRREQAFGVVPRFAAPCAEQLLQARGVQLNQRQHGARQRRIEAFGLFPKHFGGDAPEQAVDAIEVVLAALPVGLTQAGPRKREGEVATDVGVHPQEHVPEHGGGSPIGGFEGDPPGVGNPAGLSGLPVVIGGEVEVGEDRIEMVEELAVAKALGALHSDAPGHIEVQQRKRRLVAAVRFQHLQAPRHLGDHVGRCMRANRRRRRSPRPGSRPRASCQSAAARPRPRL